MRLEENAMRKTWKALLFPFIAPVIAGPLFAGALVVEVANPASNPEATARHAAVIVKTTACTSPEKTTMSATAEGIAGGKLQSVPLELIRLSQPGTFAISPNWPAAGKWVVRVVATNPDYHGYAAGVLVPIRNHAPDWQGVQRLFRAPTADDVNAALSGE
jgi:hypothetical protein